MTSRALNDDEVYSEMKKMVSFLNSHVRENYQIWIASRLSQTIL